MARGTASKHDRAVAVLRDNAAPLLRLARAHSLCADDAQDAYQRAVEIYLRRMDDVEEATAGSWLRTVVKHEAMAVRAQRQRYVGGEEVDPDQWASTDGDGEERALAFERVAQAAEALRSCKRDEVSAMVLKAEGHSYREICSITGWSYTKVNRCLAEGRARFLERYAAIESGEECRRLAPLLSAIVDGEATGEDMAAARPHLRACLACRASLRELQDGRAHIGAVLPVGLLGGIADGPAGAWDALVASVHGACLRLQALVETTHVTKAAAVAASTAALAGGGAAAVDRAADPGPANRGAPTARVEAPAAPAAAQAGSVMVSRRPRPARARSRPAAPPPPRRPDRPDRREFGFEAATAEEPAAAAAPAPPRAQRPSRDAFAFER